MTVLVMITMVMVIGDHHDDYDDEDDEDDYWIERSHDLNAHNKKVNLNQQPSFIIMNNHGGNMLMTKSHHGH